MQITKTHKIIISILILTVLVVVYIVLNKKSDKEVDTKNNNATTTITDINGNKIITNGNGYTIEEVPLTEGKIPQPNLDRPLTLYPGAVIAPEAKADAITQVKTLQAALKKSPGDFSSWINLGLYQKAGGDYEGAVITWLYVSKIAPGDFISLSNLANLHAYYLKDNGQVEVYMTEAIRRAPTQEYLYQQAVEIYRDIFKDTNKALAVVNQGLKKLPNSAVLLQLKASLQ